MARGPFPAAQQPLPGNVRSALEKRNLMDALRARPDYQQNEYLKWIATGAGPEGKQQRLDQMLDELENGKLFKGEAWTAPAPVKPATSAKPASEKPATDKPAKPAAAKPAAAKPAAAKPAKAAKKK